MAENPGKWEARQTLLAGLSPLVLALGDGCDDADDDAPDDVDVDGSGDEDEG